MPLSPTYTNWKDFDIEVPFVQLFVAPRKSGKTTLIVQLLKQKWIKLFDYVVIASPTLVFKDDYDIENVMGTTKLLKIKQGFTTILPQLIEDQRSTALLHKENPEEFEKVETLLILDDCIDSKLFKFRSAQNICDMLAERGRHFHTSLVLTSQYMSAISPSIRRNAETLFLFAPLNFADVDRTLEEYVPKRWRKAFSQRLEDMFREPFAFLLIDGSQQRRQNFKLRLRKGFSELMFPLSDREEDEEHFSIRNKAAEEGKEKSQEQKHVVEQELLDDHVEE